MKPLLMILLLMITGILSAADWLIGAEYRLEVYRDTPDQVCAIDLRRILLPIPLTNGVVLTDASQEPQNFYLDSRQCLFFPPGPAGKYYIYFGFPQQVPHDRWDRKKHGELPQNQMLTVKLLHAGGMAASEAEWLNLRTAQTNRRYTNNFQWHQKMLFWQSLYNAAPGVFMKYIPEQWTQLTFYRQAIIQKERYIRFQSLASRAQTWRFRKATRRYHPRPPVFRCGTWMQVWLPTLQRFNTIYRNRNTMVYIRKQSEKWRDELANLKNTVHGAPERELVARFSNPKIRQFGADIAREINLPKRAFDAGGTFACSYTGALHISSAGEYEFGITSNSLTMLKLGEEVITVRSGKSAPDEVVTQTVKRQLKPGMYPFALYYLKNQVTTHLTMTWKKPGDDRHTIINDLAFRPAIPVHPKALRSEAATQYPVVEREDRMELFYGKLHKAEFAGFKILEPAGLRFHWLVNGEKLPDNCLRLAILEHQPAKISLIPHDRRYAQLPVLPSIPVGTRLAVDSGVWLHPVLPVTLKHDEELLGYRELRSRLPIATTIRLRTKVTGGRSKTFQTGDQYIRMQKKWPEELDRFAEDRTNREELQLSGKELVKGLRVEWEAGIPDVVFDRKTIHFLPVGTLPPDLKAAPDGFINGSGERVIPVLRRPGLHDLRKGESLRAIKNALIPCKKLLIITENFGKEKPFAQSLEAACRKAGWVPEILCWKNSASNSGSRILDSIPYLLQAIHGSPAEAVLLIPPAPTRDDVLPDREKLRMNALLLEKLRSLPEIRQLVLATPLPDHAEEANQYHMELQTLAREYGAQWFDFGKRVRTQIPDYGKMFGNNSAGMTSSFPEKAAEKLAELLVSELPLP